MKIQKILENIGLSQNESDTYLSLLAIGNDVRISPIARKTKLPRTTVFQILERLRDEGLVLITDRRGRRMYSPTHPDKLLSILKEKHQNLGKQVESVKTALPELLQLFSTSDYQPKVRIYQGAEIKTIYEDMLNTDAKQEWYIGATKPIQDLLGKRYLIDWVKIRIAAGIHSKAIRIHEAEDLDFVKEMSDEETLQEVRYAPKDFEIGAHVIIFGNKVALITTTKESYGVLIDSKDIAKTFKSWFVEFWDQLEETKK